MTWKQLDLVQRKRLETLYKKETPISEIAARLGVHASTVYRELKRGDTGRLNEYGWPEYSARTAENRRTTTKRRKRT